jgi:hypothetical protein
MKIAHWVFLVAGILGLLPVVYNLLGARPGLASQ